jgi:hypothetical protein
MDSDVRFIAEQRVELPTLEIQDIETAESRDRHYRMLDEVEEMSDSVPRPVDSDVPTSAVQAEDLSHDPDEDRRIGDLLKINVAMKTIQIMGQILRNFPGSLRREVKLETAHETILLGLRTFSVALGGLASANGQFLGAFEEFERKERGVTDELRIREKASQMCFFLDMAIVMAFITSIADAIGSEHLKETYKELRANQESTPLRLIHLAIGLDYLRPAPLGDAIALDREAGGNIVVSLAVKALVINFLQLFPCDRAERQRVCQKLGIKIRPRMLAAKSGERDKPNAR